MSIHTRNSKAKTAKSLNDNNNNNNKFHLKILGGDELNNITSSSASDSRIDKNGKHYNINPLIFTSSFEQYNDNIQVEYDLLNNIGTSLGSVIKPDNTWDYKTFAHSNYILNNTQLAIVYLFLKYGNESPPIFEPINTPNKYYDNPIMYGYNLVTHDYHTVYRNYYSLVTDQAKLMDLTIDVYNIVDQGRNLYVQNCYRSVIYNAIAENTIIPITSRIPKNERIVLPFTDVDYILTRIRNGFFKQKKQNVDSSLIEAHAPILAQTVLNANPMVYFKQKSATTYSSPEIKEIYGIAIIPKDLQLKFDRPGKYFDEIKVLLTLNPDDGFYTYNLNGMMIPILCTHEYMLYEGKSLSLIALECYKNGKCKYCGQELIAYHIQYKDTLPPKVYDLIYKYMGTINENIEETSLLNALFQLLYDAIEKNVANVNVKNYDTAIVAFTALYLYVIYVKTKDDINYNNKIGRFIDSANNYWSEIGWTNKDIDNAINNENVCFNLSNIADIIKDKIYTNEIKFIDLLPIAVLFNTVIALKDYYTINPTTPSQKLWKSGESGMNRFHSLLRLAYLSLWNIIIFNKSLSSLKSKHIPSSSSRYNIKPTIVEYGEHFFKSTCLYYCPVNKLHEWTLKNICIHCGLNKDKSNVMHIYEKYQHIINNSFLQIPKVLPQERFKLDKIYHIKDILIHDSNELFEKYIIIDNMVLRHAILKSMDNATLIEEYIKLISVITTIDINELKAVEDKKTLIQKAICFIIDKGIKSKENMIPEIKNIAFKITNIDLLLM